MDKSKFGTNQEEHLDPAYHNGQSDAEQLMSRHLQSTTEAPLSDTELESIKIKTEDSSPSPAPKRNDDDTDDEDSGSGRMITPLDVLGS